MAIRFQLRRGTTAQNDSFVGAEGEITFDTGTKSIRVHDGVTAGGSKVPALVAVQHPTAENGYTWYRIYNDGWVEQGGYVENTLGEAHTATIVLPITMADTNYHIMRTANKGGTTNDPGVRWIAGVNANTRTTTSFQYFTDNVAYVAGDFWEVKGMAA